MRQPARLVLAESDLKRAGLDLKRQPNDVAIFVIRKQVEALKAGTFVGAPQAYGAHPPDHITTYNFLCHGSLRLLRMILSGLTTGCNIYALSLAPDPIA